MTTPSLEWKPRFLINQPQRILLNEDETSFRISAGVGEMEGGQDYLVRFIISLDEEGLCPSTAFQQTVKALPFLYLSTGELYRFHPENSKVSQRIVEKVIEFEITVTIPEKGFFYDFADLSRIGIEVFSAGRGPTIEVFICHISSFYERNLAAPAGFLMAEGKQAFVPLNEIGDSILDSFMNIGNEPFPGLDELVKSADSEEEAIQVDMVNNPPHYNDTPIDTWEMFILMHHDRPDYIKGALLFNLLKYKDRAGKKTDKDEDIEKMLWHLERLETLFEDSATDYNLYHFLRTKKQ